MNHIFKVKLLLKHSFFQLWNGQNYIHPAVFERRMPANRWINFLYHQGIDNRNNELADFLRLAVVFDFLHGQILPEAPHLYGIFFVKIRFTPRRIDVDIFYHSIFWLFEPTEPCLLSRYRNNFFAVRTEQKFWESDTKALKICHQIAQYQFKLRSIKKIIDIWLTAGNFLPKFSIAFGFH